MLTPIVTEIPRVLEPVARDTFIAPQRLERANVVRLAAHRRRDRSAPVAPARAA
jgi:hypothetical protein